MQSVKARPSIPLFQSNKFLAIAFIVVILAAIGLSIFNGSQVAQVWTLPQTSTVISEQTLAEQYGLGVNLIAVTAAGGMVDLRLKIIDGEKAKALLDDQANFPTLSVGDGVVLQASEDVVSQIIKFENGNNLFILYPNGLNAVKPGDPVSIVFGDLQVEAITAK